MRGQKRIVLVAGIFFLFSTAIFSSVEQHKQIRITNRPLKDLYSIENYFHPDQPYVPGEIVVKFEIPLSDFEVCYLVDKYLSKKMGDLHSSWPDARRLANGCFLIRFPENCRVEQMVQAFERNPYVEYAEPNSIFHITEDRSTQRIPNPPWRNRIPNLIKKIREDNSLTGMESTSNPGNKTRFPEASKKENIPRKVPHIETNLVRADTRTGREVAQKENGTPPYPETADNVREAQSFDNKLIIRSKAKIYTYRDSEGRLVVTNYFHSKSKTNKL